MKIWAKILICSLVALLVGLIGGLALYDALPPRTTSVITSTISETLTGTPDSPSVGDSLSLIHCALETLSAIEEQDYSALATYVHPEAGVTFTPSATVDRNSNLTFSSEELTKAAQGTNTYVWGTSTNTATPINLTLSDYFASYVWDRDYSASPRISLDTTQVSGNALDNTLESYPDSHYVEFYCPDPNGQAQWSTLRLVYQWYDHQWYLVGIVHSAWNL